MTLFSGSWCGSTSKWIAAKRAVSGALAALSGLVFSLDTSPSKAMSTALLWIGLLIVVHVALNTLTNYVNEVAKTEIDFPVVALRSAA